MREVRDGPQEGEGVVRLGDVAAPPLPVRVVVVLEMAVRFIQVSWTIRYLGGSVTLVN